MMTASSFFNIRIYDSIVYVGGPLAQDSLETEPTINATKSTLLLFVAAIGVAFIRLINIMNFFLFGPTETLTALGLLLYFTSGALYCFDPWYAFQLFGIIDDATIEKNQCEHGILHALAVPYTSDLMISHLGMVVLAPNAMYNLFGLKSDSSNHFKIYTY
jgi:hypothetical protein